MQAISLRRIVVQPFISYLSYNTLVSGVMLVYLLSIPADPRNRVFLGYSAARLALAGAFLGFLLMNMAALRIVRRRKALLERLSGWLFSNPATILALLGTVSGLIALVLSYLTTTRILPVFPNRFLMERLLPVLWLEFLVCLGLLPFQLGLYRRRPWESAWKWSGQAADRMLEQVERGFQWLAVVMTPGRAALLVAAVSAPLLFQAALRYEFPTGSAGFYALMAEVLRQNGLALPLQVPYYGPGGVPFAYPPAGLYLMALAEAIPGVSAFTYLRFAPPLFALLAVIPVVLIAFEFSRSRAGAALAGLIMAASNAVFHVNVTAGGVVRGLAAAFGLWAVFFFLSAARQPGWQQSWKRAALSGFLAGLSALTHLGVAQFIALFYAASLLTGLFKKRTWIDFFAAGAAGLLVVLPWVGVVYQRYGMAVFAGAFQSHENNYFLLLFQNSALMLPWFMDMLRPIVQEPLLWGMLLLGLLDALLQRKMLPVVWFGLVLFFTAENARYLVTLGALLAAVSTARLFRSFKTPVPADGSQRAAVLRGAAFLLLTGLIFYTSGWAGISSSYRPEIGAETVELAGYVQAHTPPDAVVLALAEDGEAEWFPYLLRRAPAAGTWGAEWLGTYNQNLSLVYEINNFTRADAPDALENLLARLQAPPGYLITHTGNGAINRRLSSGSAWRQVYQNPRYILWQAAPGR